MEIFDIHHHVGYVGSGAIPSIADDFTQRSALMKSCGIGTAVLTPSTDYDMPQGILDTKKVNDMIDTYQKQHSGIFPVALGTVEPRHGRESLAEIERILRELRFAGVMWHHRFQGAMLDSGMTKLYLTRIMELNPDVPVFIHNISGSGLEAPWRLENIAKAFPGITFVSLSSLSSLDNINQMIALAVRQKNVLLETGMLFPRHNVIKQVVNAIGSHRLLFGSDTYSDHPATDPDIIINLIVRAQISEEDKLNILGRNARNLFKLPSI